MQGGGRFSDNLADNRLMLETRFADCDDLVIWSWRYGDSLDYEAFSIFFDSLARHKDHNYMRDTLHGVIDQIAGGGQAVKPEHIKSFYEGHGPGTNHGILVLDLPDAETHLLRGNVLIFIDGWDKGLWYDSNSLSMRAVEEPVSESVVKGPREGTVEDLHTNIGLLRNRLQTSKFKIKKIRAGGNARTEVVYGYITDAVPQHTLRQFEERISKAADMEILETSYIEELIEDSTYSPFPQHRYTERTDTAAAAVLDGKIIVMVKGTGSILICPGLFTEFFQSSEDYYERTVISTFIRVLRIFAFFIALLLPSIYISLSTFHPELIPTVLLLAVLNTREGIPFPTFVEAVIMLFFFELLREAGIRLPRPVGSAVSIVGALIIGEAAINAGIASPMMVVIVSLTGIASFSIPQYVIAVSLRLLQLPLMIITAMLGIFGTFIGLLWIVIHLTSLRSLGQPYFSPLAPLRAGQLSDTLIRAPMRKLRSPRRMPLHRDGR